MFKNIKINQLYLVYYIKCYKLLRGFYIIETKEKNATLQVNVLKKVHRPFSIAFEREI